MSWVPRIGEDFAGYRLESMLGHGGMSIVYLAEHGALGRKVALKLLSPQLGDDESFRERFTRESRLAASLDHPNIIPIYEASESDGVFFIAMRYVKGADLRELIKAGPLDPHRTVSIIDQTANALTTAHANGLIHRDIKPGNILIDRGAGHDGSDHVYLTDFGVAKQVESPSGLTTTGMFVGTADYAAPEQIEGASLDGRADVYALGCVVYECLTGTTAFEKDSAVSLMYAHLLEPPPAVTAKRADLPAELDDIIAKAMAKSKEDRYTTPNELAAALHRVLSAVPAQSSEAASRSPSSLQAAIPRRRPPCRNRAGRFRRRPSHRPAPMTATTPPAPPFSRRRSRRTALLVAAVAAGILRARLEWYRACRQPDRRRRRHECRRVPPTTTSGSGKGADGPLLAVLAPTQVAKTCSAEHAGSPGVLESDRCKASAERPIVRPRRSRPLLLPNRTRALKAAYASAKSTIKPSPCGGSGGESVWIHPTTGKDRWAAGCVASIPRVGSRSSGHTRSSGRRITSTCSGSPASRGALPRSRPGGAASTASSGNAVRRSRCTRALRRSKP